MYRQHIVNVCVNRLYYHILEYYLSNYVYQIEVRLYNGIKRTYWSPRLSREFLHFHAAYLASPWPSFRLQAYRALYRHEDGVNFVVSPAF